MHIMGCHSNTLFPSLPFCKLLLSKSSLDVCSICAKLLKLLYEQATTLPTELSLPFEAKGGSIYQQR